MRRVWIIALVIALGSGAFGATWSLMKSPRWALYQIGRSIYHREPGRFLAYVDVEAILRSGGQDWLEHKLPQGNAPTAWGLLGQFLDGMVGQISTHAKKRVAQAVADPQRGNIPNTWCLAAGAAVDTNGDYALVNLEDPTMEGRRLRLGMRRNAEEGHWRVVELNRKDLERIIQEHLQQNQFTPGEAP